MLKAPAASPARPARITTDGSPLPPATPAINDAFTFLAARGAAFTGAGQVRWYQSGGNTFVEANVDANLGADFQVQLTGLKTLTAGDFVL